MSHHPVRPDRAVERALATGRDPRAVLRHFVAERAEQGLGFDETARLLHAAIDALPLEVRIAIRPLDATVCMGAWVRSDRLANDEAGSFDADTGFPRWPYLLARLDEHYRRCAALGLDPSAAADLWVLDLGDRARIGHGLAATGLRLEAAYRLRRAFGDGESLVALTRTATAVFAVDRPGLLADLVSVREVVTARWQHLARDGRATGGPPRLRRVPLPDRVDQVGDLVCDLALPRAEGPGPSTPGPGADAAIDLRAAAGPPPGSPRP